MDGAGGDRQQVTQEQVRDALQRLMLRHGVGRAELARQLGRPISSVNEFIRGVRVTLRWTDLTAVLAALGEDESAFLATLYGGLPAVPPVAPRRRASEARVRALLARVVHESGKRYRQIGAAIGLGKSSVHAYLVGERHLTWGRITGILAAVDVSPPAFWASLYAGAGTVEASDPLTLSERLEAAEQRISLLERYVLFHIDGDLGEQVRQAMAEITASATRGADGGTAADQPAALSPPGGSSS